MLRACDTASLRSTLQNHCIIQFNTSRNTSSGWPLRSGDHQYYPRNFHLFKKLFHHGLLGGDCNWHWFSRADSAVSDKSCQWWLTTVQRWGSLGMQHGIASHLHLLLLGSFQTELLLVYISPECDTITMMVIRKVHVQWTAFDKVIYHILECEIICKHMTIFVYCCLHAWNVGLCKLCRNLWNVTTFNDYCEFFPVNYLLERQPFLVLPDIDWDCT